MEKKLGLSALTALVLSSMLGAGVFSLPQNMAGDYRCGYSFARLCHADPDAYPS